MVKGLIEVKQYLKSIETRAKSGGIKRSLRRGAEIMRRAAATEAPIGDPKRSSLYARGKAGRPLVHPGRLKAAHVVVDIPDGVTVTIDPGSAAAEYGPHVHEGTAGRGKDRWMDRTYAKHHKKVERAIHEDVSREIDKIIK